MMTTLRAEAEALLSAVPAAKRPSLRRTKDDNYLLATNLPQLTDGAAVEAFVSQAQAKGWRIEARQGWLLLDCSVPAPPTLSIPPTFDGETGCCVSLLLRHPSEDMDARTLRRLLKATEEGASALEKLCRLWHEDWAARLRLGQPLPGGLLPYLLQALKEETS